jgi:hypothetical protein
MQVWGPPYDARLSAATRDLAIHQPRRTGLGRRRCLHCKQRWGFYGCTGYQRAMLRFALLTDPARRRNLLGDRNLFPATLAHEILTVDRPASIGRPHLVAVNA